jgi:hypothetical protein
MRIAVDDVQGDKPSAKIVALPVPANAIRVGQEIVTVDNTNEQQYYSTT